MSRSLPLLLLLGIAIDPPALPAEPADAAELHAEIGRVVAGVTRASWVQTSWQRLGEREEYTAARCLWAGQDHLRLDVFEGRGKGSVAVLDGDQVTGYRRGLFSFAKLSYPVRHPRVLSLRGRDMRDNGFLDDFRQLLRRWEQVRVAREGAHTVLSMIDDAGLDQRFYVRGSPPVVDRHEVRERGELVEVYTYAEGEYGAEFDLERLRLRTTD